MGGKPMILTAPMKKAPKVKGKIYQVVPDEQAEKHGYVRVIDESGEDYAYSADRFFPLELPEQVEEALLTASQI